MYFKKLYTFIFFLVFVISISFSQNTAEQFTNFAEKQDSLFTDAYYKKDTKTYAKLLKQTLDQYDKLDTNNQKMFAPFIAVTYYNFTCIYSLLQDKSMALLYLQKSIDAGFIDYANIQKDTDLDNIRNKNELKTKQILLL